VPRTHNSYGTGSNPVGRTNVRSEHLTLGINIWIGVNMFKCDFCDREFKTKNAKAQHSVRCQHNPNKMDMSYLVGGANFSEYNKKIKSGELVKENKNQWSNPDYVMTDATRQKITASNTGKQWSLAAKKKHSLIMKRAVEKHPESYTSSNRGRAKQVIFDGIKFQGNWELEFYKWCKSNNIKCNRYAGLGFKYVWNGERTYFPDFYLPDHGAYIEVKGFQTERDDAKWQQFPDKLIIVKKQDIINIQRNTYTLPL
jgi:hypothetical protein